MLDDTDSGNEAQDNDNVTSGTPKLFQHCVKLYELMEQHAKDTSDGKIYVGTLTNLIAEMNLSASYHTKIVNRLKAMGSIIMIKRGSGAAKSVWGLYTPPTISAFRDTDETGDIKTHRQHKQTDIQTQRINDLGRRLSKLEDWARTQGMIV